MNTKELKVGDAVRILGNAKGTCWEYGYIADITNGEALINYGTPLVPVYGMGIRKPLSQLVNIAQQQGR